MSRQFLSELGFTSGAYYQYYYLYSNSDPLSLASCARSDPLKIYAPMEFKHSHWLIEVT